jgi:uncharacterized protein (TIGR00730 family)
MAELRSLCVYCGSSARVDERYKTAAATLGGLIAARGLQLVYGGGRVGLMGIVADAALGAGAQVVGIIPEHIQALEVEHTGLTELHVVDSMHTRKRMMFDRSDAFVVLPGGLGTLDEAFEMLTWRQLKLHEKPVVFVDIDGYWRPFLRLVDHMVAQGFCRPENRDLFQVVETVEEVFGAIAAPQPIARSASDKWV